MAKSMVLKKANYQIHNNWLKEIGVMIKQFIDN